MRCAGLLAALGQIPHDVAHINGWHVYFASMHAWALSAALHWGAPVAGLLCCAPLCLE